MRVDLRVAEVVAVLYFGYAAALVAIYSSSLAHRVSSCVIPFAIAALALAESKRSRGWSRVLRDWALPGLILLAYWQIGWIRTGPYDIRLENLWQRWDGILLIHLRMREILEALGGAIPALLELAYLLVYASPVLGLAAVYLLRKRRRADEFLTTLLLTTFAAYALVPFFPALPPRLAFPGQYFPDYSSPFRVFNLWLLQSGEVATSVFPSGHIAVAFGCALGLLRVAPEKRGVWITACCYSLLVLVATVYGRYHYFADGAAGLAIALLMWPVSGWWLHAAKRSQGTIES